ncbi:class 1 isoprenoid biosynthesis enzyme [Halodesulfovibrio aestuarii]|uniref:class 1 isoprenoid biosynthesis enzyme n=1 Tax=Halodesulfovibrio aestuarii TaxID=126333 RepID=UPI00040ADC3E
MKRFIINKFIESSSVVSALQKTLNAGINRYYDTAQTLLQGNSIVLKRNEDGCYPITDNFFSFIFLYSYYKAGIDLSRCEMYVAINQALRGIVTGCDNILDDEYKCTLDTNLPRKAVKFRSVMDILVSDRVLFNILFKAHKREEVSAEFVLDGVAISLNALTPSGVQEASEEGGVGKFLSPEEIITQVHHYKTGILFTAPWAIPTRFENELTSDVEGIKDALYAVGMGCQLLDDMSDIVPDIRDGHHNYLASYINHRYGEESGNELRTMCLRDKDMTTDSILRKFPDAQKHITELGLQYLNAGVDVLFSDEPSSIKKYSIIFLLERIGVKRFFSM